MTMTVDRWQSLAALQNANDKRSAMLAARHQIASLRLMEGRLLVADFLVCDVESPGAESTPVWRLLNAIRGFGPYKAERALIRAGIISGDKRVRDLTNRQRVALAEQLRGEIDA